MKSCSRIPFITITLLIFFLFTLYSAQVSASAENTPNKTDRTILRKASLEECLKEALQNNRRRPASRFAVEMAEAQHRQALAGYWPQISVKGGYQRMDEEANFVFPARSFSMPSQTITIPGLGAVAIPKQDVNIPAQDVKLMDRESWSGKTRQ